jgi:hypothetical protein
MCSLSEIFVLGEHIFSYSISLIVCSLWSHRIIVLESKCTKLRIVMHLTFIILLYRSYTQMCFAVIIIYKIEDKKMIPKYNGKGRMSRYIF